MDTDARTQGVFAETSSESLELAPGKLQPVADAEAVAHSERNISHWMEYPPENCVNRRSTWAGT